MIVGTGCDIVEHDTTVKLEWSSNPLAKQKVLSSEEQNIHSHHPIDFISGRFAAKEAVLKCLGTGLWDGIALTDVSILKLESGKPYIKLGGQVKVLADSLGINSWHITISHSENYSIAFVIAERI